MSRSVKNFPIVPIVSLLLLSALLAGCRVVAEKPAQTAYPVPATRQVVAQPTHPPATKPSGSATAQPTPPPATKPSGSATAQPTRPPATKKPAQATAVPATAGRATRLPTATPSPSPTPAPTRGDVAFSLTILYTGEVHGEVRPCGWGVPQGGLARRASAIQQLRAQAQGGVLLLDSGNSLYTLGKPSATSDPSQGALPVEAMNAMQYDAMALGEMDLAASSEVIRARFGEAAFPILSANVGPAGALPNVQPYLLRSIDGRRVAIIGVTGPIPSARLQTLGISLSVEDALGAVRRTVEEVRSQAEVIILLSNLPRTENLKLAQEIAGLDVVIGAYGGETVNPQTVEGPEGSVILCAAGPQGKSLGMLLVHFDAQGRVVTFTGRSYALTPQFADDPAMVKIMGKYNVKP